MSNKVPKLSLYRTPYVTTHRTRQGGIYHRRGQARQQKHRKKRDQNTRTHSDEMLMRGEEVDKGGHYRIERARDRSHRALLADTPEGRKYVARWYG